jgi:hypothetical protein
MIHTKKHGNLAINFEELSGRIGVTDQYLEGLLIRLDVFKELLDKSG